MKTDASGRNAARPGIAVRVPATDKVPAFRKPDAGLLLPASRRRPAARR